MTTKYEGRFIDGAVSKEQQDFFHRLIDLGCGFMNGDHRDNKVLRYADNHALKELIAEPFPQKGLSFETLLKDIEEKVLPYSIAQSDKRFLAFPDTGNSLATLAADVLAPFCNQNTIAIDRSAPAATFIEIQTILWLRERIGFSSPSLTELKSLDQVGGMWSPGGNLSNYISVLAALYKRFPQVRREGIWSLEKRPVIVVARGIDHFSFANAAMALGLGSDGILWVEANENYQTDTRSLEQVLDNCPDHLEPFMVVSVAGTEGLVNKYYDLAQEENDAAEKIRDLKSTVDRFKILMDFYKSDKERLGAISEAGILFLSIDKDKCFFCGSSQENHAKHEAFDKNVPMIQAAAQNELGKISLMEKDLEDAIKKLLSKVDSFKKSLTSIQIDRAALKGQIENKRQLRISILDQYNQQIQQRQDATIALLNTQELNKLYQIQQEITPSAIATDNQTSKVQKTAGELLEKLSLEIESALKKWAFPLNGRVAFNTKDYDITVGGKPRKDNGKGVKAILHSAFSVGLMSYCFKEKTPHPGLLVLDSPLVTYDPAKSTGKKEFNADIRDEFFRHLEDKFKNAQVIVIDNRKCVPSWVDKLKNTTVFTLRHSAKERYGFFPVEK